MSNVVQLSVYSCPARPLRALIRFLEGPSGIIVHRGKTRPIACPGEADCQFHSTMGRWKGYAAGQVWDQIKKHWHPWVIEMTLGMLECTGTQDLRGSAWEIFREKRHYGEKCVVAIERGRYDSATLQRPFPIRKTVHTMYDQRNILWDVDPGELLHDTAEISQDPPPVVIQPEVEVKEVFEGSARARFDALAGKNGKK